MAAKKDPTMTSDAGPQTVGPAPVVDDADHSAAALQATYKDMPADMKPDPSTVAQIQEVPEDWPTGK
jgi:hypothetical protein